MKLDNFKKIIAETPDDVQIHVRITMDILDRIHELIDKKFDGKQKLLAEKLGKSEAEVSRWLSGMPNFTTKTLAKLEAAFGERIIAVCTDHHEATFVQVKTAHHQGHTKLVIAATGSLAEEKFKKIDITLSKPYKEDLPA